VKCPEWLPYIGPTDLPAHVARALGLDPRRHWRTFAVLQWFDFTLSFGAWPKA
jgi:hypothetical protein